MIASGLEGRGLEASTDHPGNCLWFSPVEAILVGTCSKSGLAVAQVEWHVEELRAALAPKEPQSHADPREGKPRETRGPKPKDFWPKVLGYAAGWLAEKGEAPEHQAELEKLLLERIAVLGGEAELSTVRPYAREMLAGYRAQLNEE